MSIEEVRQRWPRVTAHLISESLGYATPHAVARIIRDALLGQPNYCEWIDHCYRGNVRQTLRESIRSRHHHKGFMADYRIAFKIVRRTNETGEGPMLASWF